jgi:hypothetical protein
MRMGVVELLGGDAVKFLMVALIPEGVMAGLFAHPRFIVGDEDAIHPGVLLLLALQAQAFTGVVAAVNAIEGADEGEDALFLALGDGLGHGGEEETAKDEGLEFRAPVGDGLLAVADLEGIEFFAEIAEGFTEEFFLFPIDVATLTPFAEVLLGDGAAFELLGEDGLHFGLGVEPGEKGAGDFAVGEALVERFADGARETADFSAAGGGGARLDRRLGWRLRGADVDLEI